MTKRKWLIPEVVQTSELDCGPASLKSIFDGFRVPIDYGALRDLCQTGLDGTSIDTIEEIAVSLGMDAEQVVIPTDHFFLESAHALPALAVVQLPNMATHFVVVWRTFGNFVQIMDPAKGRCWLSKAEFFSSLYKHVMEVEADAWLEWACSDEFVNSLKERCQNLSVDSSLVDDIVQVASNDRTWLQLAKLDAALRFCNTLVQSKAVSKGEDCNTLLHCLYESETGDCNVIPRQFWSVCKSTDPLGGESETDSDNHIEVCGAVLIRFNEYLGDQTAAVADQQTSTEDASTSFDAMANIKNAVKPSVLAILWRYFGEERRLLLSSLLVCIVVSSLLVVFEALLFRGLLDISAELGVLHQKIVSAFALLVFLGLIVLLEFPAAHKIRELGRRFEIRMRRDLMAVVPRLERKYFRSRPVSDLAERGHSIHSVREIPKIIESILRPATMLVATTVGIVWLDPNLLLIAILAALVSLALPMLTHSYLSEKDMQVRTHEGALSRFYLDALRGLTTLKAHTAKQPLMLEQESMIVRWAKASIHLLTLAAITEAIQMLVGFSFTAWIVADHFARHENLGAVLLLVYWSLSLPAYGQDFAQSLKRFPEARNRLLRANEPLSSGSSDSESLEAESKNSDKTINAIEMRLDNFSVHASGRALLQEVNLSVSSGKSLAIVGPSGAGKSTLVSSLLGLASSYSGNIHLNGEVLTEGLALALRRRTVWIDPSVQLWDQSLLDNLMYGNGDISEAELPELFEILELENLLQQLPQGLPTKLGEGGSILSGGEGQRVRIARALLKVPPLLVLLDEPFRGLERNTRMSLLQYLRKRWDKAAFVYVSHDIKSTLGFDEVAVIEDACVVEKGSPNQLANQPDSIFNRYLQEEDKLLEQSWYGTGEWRNIYMEDGRLKNG